MGVELQGGFGTRQAKDNPLRRWKRAPLHFKHVLHIPFCFHFKHVSRSLSLALSRSLHIFWLWASSGKKGLENFIKKNTNTNSTLSYPKVKPAISLIRVPCGPQGSSPLVASRTFRSASVWFIAASMLRAQYKNKEEEGRRSINNNIVILSR